MNARDYQIKSIYEGNMRIGFIARRSTIIGCTDSIQDGWMAVEKLSYPPCFWWGNYNTRKEAAEALKAEALSRIVMERSAYQAATALEMIGKTLKEEVLA